jgi:hypothetical protein
MRCKCGLEAWLLACTMLLATGATWAGTPTQFNLGAKLHMATWSGDNPGGGKKFEAKSGMLGLEAKLQHQRWYGGLTLLGGQFTFDEVAPTRLDGYTPPSGEKVKIKRGEVDLVAGYYFWSRVSLFLDIKNVSNEWDADGYKLQYTGLGLGVSGFHPLSPSWSLFGSFGLVPMNIKAEGDKVGTATRAALNVGFLYRLSERVNFTIGVQSQSQTNDYDNGTEQTHRVGSLIVGITGSL